MLGVAGTAQIRLLSNEFYDGSVADTSGILVVFLTECENWKFSGN